MAIEIVDFPIKHGGSLHSYVNFYQRVQSQSQFVVLGQNRTFDDFSMDSSAPAGRIRSFGYVPFWSILTRTTSTTGRRPTNNCRYLASGHPLVVRLKHGSYMDGFGELTGLSENRHLWSAFGRIGLVESTDISSHTLPVQPSTPSRQDCITSFLMFLGNFRTTTLTIGTMDPKWRQYRISE